MTVNTLKSKINKELLDLSNDINFYLKKKSVPLENYPNDIDTKIEFTRNRIEVILNQFKVEWNV